MTLLAKPFFRVEFFDRAQRDEARRWLEQPAGATRGPLQPWLHEAGGFIGYGCLDPVAPDEVHLHHDLHAIIQADQDEPNAPLPRDALLISSLRKTAPCSASPTTRCR